MKLIFQSNVALARDPGFGRAEVLPSFGRPLFCYLLGSAFSARPQRDLYGRAPELAVTGAFDATGFQAHTGTAFIDAPYSGRGLIAAAAAAMNAAQMSNAGVTLTIVAKALPSTIIVTDATAQPSSEARLSAFRIASVGATLFGATINDGAAAGGQGAASTMDQTDAGQANALARYTIWTDGLNIQEFYRRAGYLADVEQAGPLVTKADADPVGAVNTPLRLGRSFAGSNVPTNENLYVAMHATWGMSTAAERAALDSQLRAVLAERGLSF